MAKRHVIMTEKVEGDHAVLNPATLSDLGVPEGGKIVVTSPTSFCVITAVSGPLVGPGQIKMPRKSSSMMHEGERVAIESAAVPAKSVEELEAMGQMPPAPAPQNQPAPTNQAAQAPQAAPTNQAPQQPQGNNQPAAQGQGQSGQAQAKGQPPPVAWESISDTSFDDIAGQFAVKARIEQSVYYLTHPEWFLLRHTSPPRVFLFFGPYGSGKTMLVKGMAGRLSRARSGLSLNMKMKSIRSTDVKDPYLGMSAKHVQQFLDAARVECNNGNTVMLVLDEIDSLVSNRADAGTHEEYRDVVNSLIQDIQGMQELDSEARIRKLWKDPTVEETREALAKFARSTGKKDSHGDIKLPEKEWPEDVKKKMLGLRQKIVDAGGVATILIVGTTNDPTRLDEAFVSRAGDNIFFVSRPDATAVEKMLEMQLDSDFVELTNKERKDLAEEAFKRGLTGRDIMLSWLQPLRTTAPGSLAIMGYESVKDMMPEPTVGIEWEMDLYRRLRERSHMLLAEQVATYLAALKDAGVNLPEGPAGGAPKSSPRAPVLTQ